MMRKRAVPDEKVSVVKKLYYSEKLCMREIAQKLGVSLDAVVYFMRRNGIHRRNFKEVNACRFEKKPMSFRPRKVTTVNGRYLMVAGAMLYWAEGHKAEKATSLDFANSDSVMVKIFLNFLRTAFSVDERKLRVLLYCYADQDAGEFIRFWSKVTGIPTRQFTRPYIRKDVGSSGRKMEHGLVHIRYAEKKLLLAVKQFINGYKERFAQVDP